MKPETLEWCRDAFERAVDFLLDDPYGFDTDPSVIPGIIARHRRVAQDLGLDFDALVAEMGSPYEIERLQKLERLVDTK
jgi:hypothetical protein